MKQNLIVALHAQATYGGVGTPGRLPMYSFLMALATVWSAPASTTSPRMDCPKIQLVQINLAHKIDRGVYLRTRKRCRTLYKKSPCLVKLEQIRTGAFN